MTEILYIRLGSQAQDEISWLIFNTLEQEIIASGALANASHLSELTEKAVQRAVKVFVPGCDVLLKRLVVPTKSTKAMRAAVPYMLEDELAQDVDDLFFAYANISTTNTALDDNNYNCFVAITSRAQMQLWQSWLLDANINTKFMQPDVLAMPYVADQWSAIALHPSRADVDTTQVVVRQGQWQGFTLDSLAWQFTLQHLVSPLVANKKQSDKLKTDEALTINAYSALPGLDSTDADDMTSAITVVTAEEELPLALFAQHSKDSFNLLQGEFKVTERRSKHMSSWLWAAGFAACALLMNVGYKSAQLWQLNAQQADVESQIITQYKKAFPNAKRVRIGTIKSQLTRELSQLGSVSEQAGFLSILSQVQPAFAKVKGLTPESLKFDGKRQELRLQAIADNYQQFEQFKNALNLVNVTVKQGAQNNQGEQVTGSFSIVSKEGS